jgi:hypothetical protein
MQNASMLPLSRRSLLFLGAGIASIPVATALGRPLNPLAQDIHDDNVDSFEGPFESIITIDQPDRPASLAKDVRLSATPNRGEIEFGFRFRSEPATGDDFLVILEIVDRSGLSHRLAEFTSTDEPGGGLMPLYFMKGHRIPRPRPYLELEHELDSIELADATRIIARFQAKA